jgi:hypothetical protein
MILSAISLATRDLITMLEIIGVAQGARGSPHGGAEKPESAPDFCPVTAGS